MFILRQIFKDNTVQNTYLGERYSVIKKEESSEEFNEALGKTDSHPDSNKIYAILFYDDGERQKLYPLYIGFSYYIMIDNGKTFENISRKIGRVKLISE